VRSRASWVVLAACAVTALAGCAAIPSSGPVSLAPPQTAANGTALSPIQLFARPPQPASPPEQIVAGFLQASSAMPAGSPVARDYLTPTASARWRPGASTVVYDDASADGFQIAASRGDPATVTLQAREVAQVSARGVYTPRAGRLVETFTVSKVAGQWRITALPQGLLLTPLDIARSFHFFNAYFPDPTLSHVLVPDPVLLPLGVSPATSLVDQLVAGPTPWLAPAVATGFPAGTRLVGDSVPVVGGVATVTLSGPTPDSAHARALAAQLVWTLRQLPDITDLLLTWNGDQLPGQVAGPLPVHGSFPSFDPDALPAQAALYYRASTPSGRRLVRLVGSLPKPVPGPLGQPGRAPSVVAVSLDETTAAGLGDDASTLLVGPLGSRLREVAHGTRFTPPSFDVFGDLWTLDRGRGDVVATVPAGSHQDRLLDLSGLPAGPVDAFRVARDGTRVAVAVGSPAGGERLFLGLVRRTASGVPFAVTDFRALSSDLIEASAVTWASADQLLVLGAVPTAPGELQAVTVDLESQQTRALGAPVQGYGTEGAVVGTIAGAPGRPPVVATSDGRVWTYEFLTWTLLDQGDAPAYPG